MMHKDDLKRVAPLWLQFSKAVRHDPDVRRPHPMLLHAFSLPFAHCAVSSPVVGQWVLKQMLLASITLKGMWKWKLWS